MKAANEAQLAKLEETIKDAEENLGDIEVREAYLAKADYLYKIGAWPSAYWKLLLYSYFVLVAEHEAKQ